MRNFVPWALVLARLALAPALVLSELAGALTDRLVLGLYLSAFLSDYLDGAIARRLGCATPLLRRADSTVDVVFHLAFAAVTLSRHPGAFAGSSLSLGIFFATLAGWYAFDAVRWRRPAGYHSLLAKAFAVAIAAWTVGLYAVGESPRALGALLALGTLVNVEGVAIGLVLREPATDVLTLGHAWRLRRQRLDGRS
jgi:CDP-diacylglycerol--glycerol-3-phosphate 3-phosphatidyltransferase